MSPHIVLNPHKYSLYIYYLNILHDIGPSQILHTQAHKIALGPLTNITHYSPHIIQLGFSQKYSSYCYHIEPQNYIISIKSPKTLILWENPKSPTKTSIKPVATQHPKSRCYTILLQSPLLHSTLKPVATRHLYKARCYTIPLKPTTMRHL